MHVIRKPEVLEAVQVKDLLNSPDAWPERLESQYKDIGLRFGLDRQQFLATRYTANPEYWLLISESGITVDTGKDFDQRFDPVISGNAPPGKLLTMLEAAWGILANINWHHESKDWQHAAAKWRDCWFSIRESRPATQGLTFDDLRAANIKRIPLFKNRKGVVVHKPDGSDLSVAEWFRNLMGEAGEFAGWHKKWQLGEIDDATYKKESAKELADIQTYLDILAFRVGVDLGEATRQKFNEVSERFNCEVRL